MTAEDEALARESIRDTLARYNSAGDRLRHADFIAVFTEDAVFESEASFHHVGRPAIQAWIDGWGGTSSASGGRRPTFVRHNVTTSEIEVTGPESARARTYFHVYSDIGADHAGHYTDVFRRCGDRWLICHRRVRIDWRSPQSLFAASA
jgi:ketosteroid isomerase-like protein